MPPSRIVVVLPILVLLTRFIINLFPTRRADLASRGAIFSIFPILLLSTFSNPGWPLGNVFICVAPGVSSPYVTSGSRRPLIRVIRLIMKDVDAAQKMLQGQGSVFLLRRRSDNFNARLRRLR